MLRGIVRSARPHQWVKNAFVLAPLIFSLNVGEPALVWRALWAFAVFCLISSSVYYLNDLVDIEADRAHPLKRQRPIASGQVPVAVARIACGVALALALGGALVLNWQVALVAALYFGLNLAYSLRLKHYAFVDVSIIATGFLLRVLAGSLAIAVVVSTFLVLCTFSLALFLALGKRMHELRGSAAGAKQRAVLGRYRKAHVHWAMVVVGSVTLLAYVAYTLAPHTQAFFGFGWPRLVLTVPFTAFGLYRFHRLVSPEHSAMSPTEQMLKDKPFLLNLVLWGAVVVAAVYLP